MCRCGWRGRIGIGRRSFFHHIRIHDLANIGCVEIVGPHSVKTLPEGGRYTLQHLILPVQHPALQRYRVFLYRRHCYFPSGDQREQFPFVHIPAGLAAADVKNVWGELVSLERGRDGEGARCVKGCLSIPALPDVDNKGGQVPAWPQPITMLLNLVSLVFRRMPWGSCSVMMLIMMVCPFFEVVVGLVNPTSSSER